MAIATPRQVGLGCIITSIVIVLNKVFLATLIDVRVVFPITAMKGKKIDFIEANEQAI